MRTRLAIGGCIIAAATAMIAGARSARAAPPDSLTFMEIETPVVACHTKDQMMQVIQSIKAGRLSDKLSELEAIKDGGNEAQCVYSPLSIVVFGKSDHIGRIDDVTVHIPLASLE
jgi:hypothetical protein